MDEFQVPFQANKLQGILFQLLKYRITGSFCPFKKTVLLTAFKISALSESRLTTGQPAEDPIFNADNGRCGVTCAAW